MATVRIVHYLNQFFGGIGGEEQADTPLASCAGPVGPGQVLQAALGVEGEIVRTIICGDNYFHEHEAEAVEAGLAAIREAAPDVLALGPTFAAGRYGLAAGKLGVAVRKTLRIPVAGAMAPENPAVEAFRSELILIPCGSSAAGLREAIPALARLALKLGRGEALGPAAEEGYFPTGRRRPVRIESSAARRAVDLLLARYRGEPFTTELPMPAFDTVSPPPPVPSLATATVAIVTESGLVPIGNPDRIQAMAATRWNHYPLGDPPLPSGQFLSVHGGYNNQWVNEDPNRVVPADALRDLERAGRIGHLLDEYYVTVGNGGSIEAMRRIGREMAEQLREREVAAAVVPAT